MGGSLSTTKSKKESIGDKPTFIEYTPGPQQSASSVMSLQNTLCFDAVHSARVVADTSTPHNTIVISSRMAEEMWNVGQYLWVSLERIPEQGVRDIGYAYVTCNRWISYSEKIQLNHVDHTRVRVLVRHGTFETVIAPPALVNFHKHIHVQFVKPLIQELFSIRLELHWSEAHHSEAMKQKIKEGTLRRDIQIFVETTFLHEMLQQECSFPHGIISLGSCIHFQNSGFGIEAKITQLETLTGGNIVAGLYLPHHHKMTHVDSSRIEVQTMGVGVTAQVDASTEDKNLVRMREALTALTPDALRVAGLSDQEKLKICNAMCTRFVHPRWASAHMYRTASGIMLEGPPGTGKTYLAQLLSRIAGFKLKCIQGSQVHAKYLGESEENTRALFKEADEDADKALAAGTVAQQWIVFIDEIDALISTRREADSGASRAHNSVVAELLGRMDGTNNRGNVLIIGTTNRITDIDPAFLRKGRFDLVIHMGVPTAKERADILRIHLSGDKCMFQLTPECCDRLAHAMPEGTVGADIKSFIDVCIQHCMEQQLRAVMDEKAFSTLEFLKEDGGGVDVSVEHVRGAFVSAFGTDVMIHEEDFVRTPPPSSFKEEEKKVIVSLEESEEEKGEEETGEGSS